MERKKRKRKGKAEGKGERELKGEGESEGKGKEKWKEDSLRKVGCTDRWTPGHSGDFILCPMLCIYCIVQTKVIRHAKMIQKFQIGLHLPKIL